MKFGPRRIERADREHQFVARLHDRSERAREAERYGLPIGEYQYCSTAADRPSRTANSAGQKTRILEL